MEILNSQKFKDVVNKILLACVFYLVAAASFNGFFVKWAFLDVYMERNSFKNIVAETADRPFVNRQLMVKVAKGVETLLPESRKERWVNRLQEHDFIPEYYAKAKIDPSCLLEYHIVYFMTFLCLFISMFIWRQLCADVTGSKLAGTLTACIFSLLFPVLETVGGYFYDFGELLFFSAAALFAYRGWWLPLILITPFAEYNKESFLFFVATLFPLLMVKVGKKKTTFIIAFCVFLSGCVYLHVSSLYLNNAGGSTEFHLPLHIQLLFKWWANTDIIYGMYFGQGTFFLYALLVAWLIKSVWSKLSSPWKHHAGLVTLVNVPLYLLFCIPGELRNLSMMYIGFMVMLSIFINDFILAAQRQQQIGDLQ